MKTRTLIQVLAVSVFLGCAALPMVAQDLGNIAAIVLQDVMAGKPFDTVLKDTGSDDVQLLIAIISGIEGDPNPNLSASEKAAYVKACQPYLVEATHRLAILQGKHDASRVQ